MQILLKLVMAATQGAKIKKDHADNGCIANNRCVVNKTARRAQYDDEQHHVSRDDRHVNPVHYDRGKVMDHTPPSSSLM